MRLIDADKLIDEIKNSLWDWESVDGITATTVLKQTITDIENQTTVLLKEQEAVQWINVKDRLPKKDGQYLVVYTFFNCKGMGVVRFSHNLHEVDEYIFNEESRPGWYEPDDEVGYFERTTVTHWAKLPEFPKEGR